MEDIYHRSQFGEDWFTFPNLYSRMVKLFPSSSRFVEVGSWKGKSSAYMAVKIANSNKDIEFYCVDTWEGAGCQYPHLVNDMPKDLYESFLFNMKPVNKYYFPLKLKSLDAVEKFKDNSLDFVFIDASHEYKDVKDDILAWLPKVKNNGILAGHDYTSYWPGVVKAVDETLGHVFADECCWIYYKNKLLNFPSINCISINESINRRSIMLDQFQKHNISNYTFHIYDRYTKDNLIKVNVNESLNINHEAVVISHLKTIKNWLENSTEEYTIFCEDDLSFETIPYWNFVWKEFFDSLPSNWGCIQLVVVRENDYERIGKLRDRYWCDWSTCAYLMKRDFAHKLIELYHPSDNEFNLIYAGNDAHIRDNWALRAATETIVYTYFADNRVYTFPLFVENINLPSTYSTGSGHIMSNNIVKNLWQNTFNKMSTKEILSKYEQ